jgi:dimethylargininase
LKVEELETDERFPDSTFVEDVALLTPHCAIITNPGAPSRKGEITAMKKVIQSYYSDIEEISTPGTVEAGDIMMVGDHYYIGLSDRTNQNGADQVIQVLNNYGMTGSVIEVGEVLHLKTGMSYLENDTIVACNEFSSHPELERFKIIEVPEEESYAANCIWINGTVITPKGFPVTKKKIENAGYLTIAVNVSEFEKLDGGLSCLSLRF